MLASNSQTQCPLHATSLTCLSTGSSHLGPRLYVVFVERRHDCNTLSIWRCQVLNHCWSSWAAFSQAVHWCDLNIGIMSLKRRLKQQYKHVPAPFFSTDLLNSHLVSNLELTAVYHQSCPQQKQTPTLSSIWALSNFDHVITPCQSVVNRWAACVCLLTAWRIQELLVNYKRCVAFHSHSSTFILHIVIAF